MERTAKNVTLSKIRDMQNQSGIPKIKELDVIRNIILQYAPDTKRKVH